MNTITVEDKYILEYIKDILNDSKVKADSVDNARYHHNTGYTNAPSICKYGILTLEDLSKKNLYKLSPKFLEIMSDIDSHANGKDCVSLSVIGLEDLYPTEYEYNPLSLGLVDFLVSNKVKAGRFSVNYGNEFLSFGSIPNSMLKSVDIRLLKLMGTKPSHFVDSTVESIIYKYNKLIEIAYEMKQSNLDIQLREMSNDCFAIDIDKVSSEPKLLIKKH